MNVLVGVKACRRRYLQLYTMASREAPFHPLVVRTGVLGTRAYKRPAERAPVPAPHVYRRHYSRSEARADALPAHSAHRWRPYLKHLSAMAEAGGAIALPGPVQLLLW